ncbi:hypothetical protein ACLOJK_009842 [Asimina triloba]
MESDACGFISLTTLPSSRDVREMAESGDDAEDPIFLPKTTNATTPSVARELMDLDLDLDTSWPLDPNPSISNPSSPLLFSCFSSQNLNQLQQQSAPLCSSDQPSSPLWTFSDTIAVEEKLSDSPRSQSREFSVVVLPTCSFLLEIHCLIRFVFRRMLNTEFCKRCLAASEQSWQLTRIENLPDLFREEKVGLLEDLSLLL